MNFIGNWCYRCHPYYREMTYYDGHTRSTGILRPQELSITLTMILISISTFKMPALIVVQRHKTTSRSARPSMRGQHGGEVGPTTTVTKSSAKARQAVKLGQLGGGETFCSWLEPRVA